MKEFLKWVEKAPSRMTHLIASEIHKYVSFLVAVHDPNFVLEIEKHFDPNTR